jgi:hypothetical protein
MTNQTDKVSVHCGIIISMAKPCMATELEQCALSDANLSDRSSA